MNRIKSLFLAIGLAASPLSAMAEAPAVAPAAAAVAPAAAAEATPAAKSDVAKPAETTIGTSKADPLIGQPVVGKIGIQPQVTELGVRAKWFHDYPIQIIMGLTSLLVLILLFIVVIRFRAKANPVPSKTSHNTLIEVIWTAVPALILAGLAIPSLSLINDQFKPAGKDAITLKAIGNQWYWQHQYPDYGVEVTSIMLSDEEAKAKGEPRLLGVDNRIVIPVNRQIRLVTTANDVIHAWAVPAFWIKLDAVPGRLNETTFTVTKTGVYYGQCSELCGIKHGFMPIAVEVVSQADFDTWVHAKGGKTPAEKKAEEDAAAAKAAAEKAATVTAAPAENAAAPAVNAAAPAAPAATK